jgi:hypothetical protein
VFFIFGWRTKSSAQGPALATECHHCRNDVNWVHVKATDWIELFFIPLIPVRSKHYLVCDVCQYGIELDGEEAGGIGGLDEMTPDMRREWQDYLRGRIEKVQLGDLSDTQRNWHREQDRRG